MLKLNSILPSPVLSSVPSQYAGTVCRLMVLIPGVEIDHSGVIHRIWELAHALGCSVLFLGLCRDEEERPAFRRALFTMSALVQDGWISTEVKAVVGNDWLKVVKANLREGDLIVCSADHRTGLMQRPLSRLLESKLNATVYLLSGLDLPESQARNWLSALMLWIGFAVTVMGFFFLQVSLDRALRGWVHTFTLALTVLVEFWLVWVWNSLFG